MSEASFPAVLRHLARERLAVDETVPGRTAFLSHLGAAPRLRPGPWIAHRDLIYALALANLSPAQRASLVTAVRVEYDRPFGVGRLDLRAVPSDLPYGGALLWMRPRSGGPSLLHAWGLGRRAAPKVADWLVLRAHPSFASDTPPTALDPTPLARLAPLGDILILVDGAVTARLVADACRGVLPLAAHPRFAPHLEGLDPDAAAVLWPHDALGSRGLRRRRLAAMVLVDAPEKVRLEARHWLRTFGRKAELAEAGAPGYLDREGLARFLDRAGHPSICLRGDPALAASAAAFLRDLGRTVTTLAEPTQLDLF